MTPEALTGKRSHREERNADAVETSSCADISSTSVADETRHRLEFELAIALARQPKHKSLLGHEGSSDEDPLRLPESADVASNPVCGTSSTALCGEPTMREVGTDLAARDQADATSQSGEARRKRWLKSARRTNRSKLVGTVASFAITPLVTAFILSLVAVFLFGLSTNRNYVDGSSGVTSVKQAPQSAQGTEPKPVAARSSWIFQGR